MQLLTWDAGRSVYSAVAVSDVVVGEHWQLPPGAWAPVTADKPEPNPYAAGVLFHGPAYQLLAELRLDGAGATYWLDLDASGVPVGMLNQGLLDAATHGIPHDALWRWSSEIARDVAAYPVAITAASFYGPTPERGQRALRGAFWWVPRRRPPVPGHPCADHSGRRGVGGIRAGRDAAAQGSLGPGRPARSPCFPGRAPLCAGSLTLAVGWRNYQPGGGAGQGKRLAAGYGGRHL